MVPKMVRIENGIERMEFFLCINTTHMPQCNETYEPLSNLNIGNIKIRLGPSAKVGLRVGLKV
jgi:hypothetical protein